MKRTIHLWVLIALGAAGMLCVGAMSGKSRTAVAAGGADSGIWALPDVSGEAWGDLGAALKGRSSDRGMTAGERVEEKELARMLWAACGKNRKDGKWTIATALDRRDLRVYACMEDGAWLYDSAEHLLRKVSEKDLRGATGTQEFAVAAAVELVYVGKLSVYDGKGPADRAARERMSLFHAGEAAQGVGLTCAAGGLKCVVHALHTAEEEATLRAELGLEESDAVLMAQAVGR